MTTALGEMSDKDVVELALQRLPQNNYRAGELLGVSEGTVRRLRRGDAELRDATREALIRFLEGKPAEEVEAVVLDTRGLLDREGRLAEARMATMRLDAETRLLEAEASVIRARAYERAEANAELRTWAAAGFRVEPNGDDAEEWEPLAPGEATRILRQFLRGRRRGERPGRTA